MSSHYRRHGALPGHIGAVYSIVVTDDGRYLASGGYDGTRLWDLQTLSEIPRPAFAGARRSTTAITWTNRDDEPGEMLFYGTVAGFLICWRQANQGFMEVYCRQLSQGAEITGIDFDSQSNRLAVCNSKSVVQLYTLSSNDLKKIFAVSVTNFVPRALRFGAMRGNERELLAFGLHDGKIRSFTTTSPIEEQVEFWEIGGGIGDAVVDSRRGAICIDDLEFGAVLYRLDDHQRVKMFPIPTTRDDDLRPRQVRFLDESRTIAIGSDHGAVYVFDRRSGDVIDKLRLDGEDWAQTIATSDSHGIPTLFAASSGSDGGHNDIIIWKKALVVESPPPANNAMIDGVLGVVLVAGLGFAYEHREWLGNKVQESIASLKYGTAVL
ncbi:WD40-repeat-containing domain protein [Mycena filopes]|nr:WD40-repeat-containing domain protein [Mycena filopes]